MMGRGNAAAACALLLLCCCFVRGDHDSIQPPASPNVLLPSSSPPQLNPPTTAEPDSLPKSSPTPGVNISTVQDSGSANGSLVPAGNQTQENPLTDPTMAPANGTEATPGNSTQLSGNFTHSKDESAPSFGENRTVSTVPPPTPTMPVPPADIPKDQSETSALTPTSPPQTPPAPTKNLSADASAKTTSASQEMTHAPTTAIATATATTTTTTTVIISNNTESSKHQSSTPVQTKTGMDTPSQLNVGDEDSSASLDPLLAGLVSVFVVTAAIVSLLIFLKFRHRNERPEFRRLQDLPMDDMMEDTPLSMYSY